MASFEDSDGIWEVDGRVRLLIAPSDAWKARHPKGLPLEWQQAVDKAVERDAKIDLLLEGVP